METHGEAQYFLDNYDSSVKVIKDEDEEGALVSRSRIQEEDDENDSNKNEIPQALKPTSWTKIDQLITLL